MKIAEDAAREQRRALVLKQGPVSASNGFQSGTSDNGTPCFREDTSEVRVNRGHVPLSTTTVHECIRVIRMRALKILGQRATKDDIDEIVQRSLLCLLERLPTYQGEGTLSAFAAGIGKNHSMRYTKELARRAQGMTTWPHGNLEQYLQDTAEKQDARMIQRQVIERFTQELLSRLSRRERDVFDLMINQELDVAECARLLKVSRANIAQVRYQIRQKAKSILKESHGADDEDLRKASTKGMQRQSLTHAAVQSEMPLSARTRSSRTSVHPRSQTRSRTV